jgi:SAM-dependent methyltransferase
MTATTSPRDERAARLVDREVAPLWHDRFARMMWRHLPDEPPDLVLEVHAAAGRTTTELLGRLPARSKIIALEPDPLLRELAKARVAEHKDRVYLKAGGLDDIASMAAASYDLVVANLVLGETASHDVALRELLRITKPGGQVLATLPLEGSWAEPEDLYREVLRDASLRDVVRRLKRLGQLRPTGHELSRILIDSGCSPHHFVIEQERFELLFAGGREFLFSPVIEHGPLRLWKAIIGDAGKPQEIFWRLKESIDTYFHGHVFGVTVVAGLVRVHVPEAGAAAQAAADTAGAYWSRWPELDALWQAAERRDQAADLDVEIDVDTEAPEPSEPQTDVERALPSSSMSMMSLSAEDAAIFALLDQPAPAAAQSQELDALLDQVLEFAAPDPNVTEIDEDELQEAEDDEYGEPEPDLVDASGRANPGRGRRAPVDTLQRIRALLPPPPGAPTTPPPPPTKRRP